MADTSIEWTNKTWNPVVGCARVSPGCENCYAERMAQRLELMGQERYVGLTRKTTRGRVQWSGMARFVPEMLGAPLRVKKPQMWFVNSMSDLFHDDITNEQIAAVFGVMAACPQHTFQVLTKRPERMVEWFNWVADDKLVPAYIVCALAADRLSPGVYDAVAAREGGWPLNNVWLGVSVEDQARAHERIPKLLSVPAAVRWVSAEPLLGPLDLDPAICDGCGEPAADAVDDGTAWCAECDREGSYGHWLDFQDDEACNHAANGGITWVVVGGESGVGARSFELAWARDVIRVCGEHGTRVFCKQLGGRPVAEQAVVRLRDRKGGDIDEWPGELQVRQMPEVVLLP